MRADQETRPHPSMLSLNSTPFPALETERLLLRRVTMNDAPAVLAMRSDVDAMRYIDRPRATTLADAEALIGRIDAGLNGNTAVGWGLEWKAQPGLIGTIGYHRVEAAHYRAEIGYMLHPAHWRQGVMSEALATVLAYGLGPMGLHSVEAHVNPDNEASIALLLKHGFVREAYFRENCFYEGKFMDTAVYGLVKS